MICREVERQRENNFRRVRLQFRDEVREIVMVGLQTGGGRHQVEKALRFAKKVGLFQYRDSVSAEIDELEQRFGLSFETIVDVVFRSGILDDFSEDDDTLGQLRLLAGKVRGESGSSMAGVKTAS